MKKIKIFEGRTATQLETRVNDWLASNKVNIISLNMSTIGHGPNVVAYTLIAYYEETFVTKKS